MNIREIKVSQDQLADWQTGTLIQDAMPDVPDEDREYIKTGITPDMWNSMFGDSEEHYEESN